MLLRLQIRWNTGSSLESGLGSTIHDLAYGAPGGLNPVTVISPTTIGEVSYVNAFGNPDWWQEVDITLADVDAGGWIRINGKAVTVDMRNGTTSVVNSNSLNFLRTDELMVLNSAAISTAHPVRMPTGLPKSDAGRSRTTTEQAPIRRYRLRFEVRDATTLAKVHTNRLDSIIIDNRKCGLGAGSRGTAPKRPQSARGVSQRAHSVHRRSPAYVMVQHSDLEQ